MSEEIVSLVVDHRGWLWVGEDAGVTVYDGHRWRSFTQDDGLIWNDTDSFALDRRSGRQHVDRHFGRTESPDRAAGCTGGIAAAAGNLAGDAGQRASRRTVVL